MKRGAQAIRPEDVDDNYPIVPDGMVERCNELIRRSMLRGSAKFYYFDFHESFGPFDPHVVEQLVDKYREAGWDVVYPTVHAKEPFIFTKPVKRNRPAPQLDRGEICMVPM